MSTIDFNSCINKVISPRLRKLPGTVPIGPRLSVLTQDVFQSTILEKNPFLTKLFANLDSNTQKIVSENPKIKEFYYSFSDSIFKGITPETIAKDLSDPAFIKGLNLDYANTKFEAGSDEVFSLASVIAKRNSYLKEEALSEFLNATTAKNVTYQSRSKSASSTFDKLNNKIKDGYAINSFEDANKLIGDGIGIRAIFQSLDAKSALNALKKAGYSEGDIANLKSLWLKDPDSLTKAESRLVQEADIVLTEAQTQSLIDSLAKSISVNAAKTYKIENYGHVPYLSGKQLEQLHKSWRVSDAALDGMEFKVISRISPESEAVKKYGLDEAFIREMAKKSAKPSGYTASQLNFIFSNGAFGEGQLRGTEIQKFAEYEHIPYDIRKGKKTVERMIRQLVKEGKMDVASELIEYKRLVKKISEDYSQYNQYFKNTYNYLRDTELGKIAILGDAAPGMPKLQIEGLTAHENELLSKECLESLANKEYYTFKNP